MNGPKRDALLRRLATLLLRREGGQALIVVRVRKLTAIEALAGPDAVDDVLRASRERLQEAGGAGALVADLGEGTFGLVCPVASGAIEEFAGQILLRLSRPVQGSAGPLFLPGNAGACAVDALTGDAIAHVERALGALQRAMARSAGTVELASEARIGAAAADWEMRSSLEEAAMRGEFVLEYQPILSLASGSVSKVEALLRWDSPDFGRVSPERFIPLLEDTGLIRPVGEWVLREVCMQVRAWRLDTGLPVRIAVNVSPVQVCSDFEAIARRILAESHCEAAWIELEITEGALVRDFVLMRERLHALAALGFTLAIDDFGAGYSSLGQLAQLPVHEIKMDRSLIEGMPDGGKRAGIVQAVVALADGLGLALTSEGVESREQADWLARFGSIQAQGYLFDRPMSADAIAPLLRAGGYVKRP